MSKKLRLDYQQSDNFVLLGIATPLKDYKLCWHINNDAGYRLIRIEDFIPADTSPDDDTFFSFYFFEEKENFKQYILLQNKTANGVMLPSQKHFDFFLLIFGSTQLPKHAGLISKIKKIPNVLTVVKIEPSSIKNIQAFISDVELHILESRLKNNLDPTKNPFYENKNYRNHRAFFFPGKSIKRNDTGRR